MKALLLWCGKPYEYFLEISRVENQLYIRLTTIADYYSWYNQLPHNHVHYTEFWKLRVLCIIVLYNRFTWFYFFFSAKKAIDYSCTSNHSWFISWNYKDANIRGNCCVIILVPNLFLTAEVCVEIINFEYIIIYVSICHNRLIMCSQFHYQYCVKLKTGDILFLKDIHMLFQFILVDPDEFGD